GAAEEAAVAAPAHDERPAALGALGGLRRDDLAQHLVAALLALLERLLERAVELAEHLAPVQVALLDAVQLALHLAGEAHVEEVREQAHEELRHRLTQRRGVEALLLELDVLPVHERGDDLRVRRGPADAELLQLLHQARLAEARRRLREVLRRHEVDDGARLPGLQRGERGEVVQRAVVALLAGLRVEAGEAVELHDRPGGAEQVEARAGVARGVPAADREVDGRGVVDRRRHLAGDEAEPDELVETELVAVEIVLHGLGRAGRVRGADGLVGLLRALLLLAGPETRRTGDVAVAEALEGPGAGGRGGLGGDAGGVGPHVGDETDGALAADVDALVELLGRAHGLARREAEPLGRLLLERGGGEGRRRILCLLAAPDIGDDEGGAFDVGKHVLRGGLVLEAEGLAIDVVEPGLEALARALEQRGDGPVLLGLEGADLGLALGDEAERDGLDAACGEAGPDRLPEDGADLVADEAIEDAARLLRLDLAHVDDAGALERAAHGVPGDFVEEDAVEARSSIAASLAVVGVAELLRDVVRDGLALAVGVGGEDDLLGAPGLLLELLDDLALAPNGDVARLEAVLDVDAQLALGQVTDVARRSADTEPGAEILADRPGLGRRFDDDEP